MTEVQVWSAALDRRPDDLSRLLRVLDSEERARAERFRFARDRDRFIVRRAFRRMILARHLAADPAKIAFGAGPNGKPLLAADPDLNFSESESGGLAVVGVARGARVGVDVELVRPVAGAARVIDRFATSAERDAYGRLHPDDRLRGFFRWWTAKEALIKAVGSGLAEGLAGLSPGPGWHRSELRIGPGHVGCLVTEGELDQRAAS